MVARTVARTRADNVRPLGEPGQRSYEFIVGILLRELTPSHAALFAEPSDRPGATSWRTESAGRIESLETLSPDEAAALRSALGRLVADILAVADRYAVKPDPAAQAVAIALRNAVEIPSDECIFRVGEQPVIVQWAHHLELYEPPRGLLSRMIAARPSVVEPAGDVVDRSTGPAGVAPMAMAPAAAASVGARAPWYLSLLWWLGWLLLALLIFMLFRMALPACGVSTGWAPYSLFDSCEVRAEALPRPDAESERAALEAEIASLERAIADADRQCVAQAPPPAQTTPAGPPSTIEEVIRDKDQTKLAGCWDLDSDYRMYINRDKSRPLTVSKWRVCFDESSRGSQDLEFSNGMTCGGDVEASFGDDDLTILDEGNVPCSQGMRIIQRRIVCRVQDDQRAHCKARHVGADNNAESNVILKRSD